MDYAADRPVTKQELKEVLVDFWSEVSKDLVTKNDIKDMVVKDDIKDMVTNRSLMDKLYEFWEAIFPMLTTVEDFEGLEQRVIRLESVS